ncbi:S-adenosylmethionine decarboxylase [Candidatus Woesearchaeota archaeon]|nr:S-adenosylmethionine decarboxylase [Candidatus Woesearchaeota archaeon]
MLTNQDMYKKHEDYEKNRTSNDHSNEFNIATFEPAPKNLIMGFYNCNADVMKEIVANPESFNSKLESILREEGIKIVESMTHSFKPGYSIAGILSESDFGAHISPESENARYVDLSIRSCGLPPISVLKPLIQYLKPERVDVLYFQLPRVKNLEPLLLKQEFLEVPGYEAELQVLSKTHDSEVYMIKIYKLTSTTKQEPEQQARLDLESVQEKSDGWYL